MNSSISSNKGKTQGGVSAEDVKVFSMKSKAKIKKI